MSKTEVSERLSTKEQKAKVRHNTMRKGTNRDIC